LLHGSARSIAGLIGSPLFRVAVGAVSGGGLALPGLRILNEGAVLAVELAQHAEGAAGLDLTAALAAAAGVAGAVAAVAESARRGVVVVVVVVVLLLLLLLRGMTSGRGRRDGSGGRVNGKDGGHGERLQAEVQVRSGEGWGGVCGRLANQRPRCLSSGDKARQAVTSNDE
jgi:hypothetical protein